MKHAIAVGMIGVTALFSEHSAYSKEGIRKNLLFIITDQQRYDALGYAGNSVIETPNLDRLVQQGAYFSNAYTPCVIPADGSCGAKPP